MTQDCNFFEQTFDTVPQRTTLSKKEEIKRILEGLLFSSSEPVPFDKLKEIITSTYPLRSLELKVMVEELREEYRLQKRGFQIDEIAEGYLLRTVEEVYVYVEMLHQNRRGEKLSRAATEVLAIVAYKQPITRSQVEAIRGVDSSGTLASLLERGLIEIAGRLEAPGRPAQYATTPNFLKHFGLKTLDDLSRAFLLKKESPQYSVSEIEV